MSFTCVGPNTAAANFGAVSVIVAGTRRVGAAHFGIVFWIFEMSQPVRACVSRLDAESRALQAWLAAVHGLFERLDSRPVRINNALAYCRLLETAARHSGACDAPSLLLWIGSAFLYPTLCDDTTVLPRTPALLGRDDQDAVFLELISALLRGIPCSDTTNVILGHVAQRWRAVNECEACEQAHRRARRSGARCDTRVVEQLPALLLAWLG